jgi:hypothetical protein
MFNRSTIIAGLVTVVALYSNAPGQAQPKGIDTQTQKIKQDTNKTTRAETQETDATRSFNWGKGKTEVRARLANPYRLASRRDALIESIKQVIKDRKMLVDEASSRPADGIIVTQPFQFSKGAVTARSEISRYGVIQFADNAWSRGRYTLVIEVQSIDGVQNNVSVNAKVEGRAGNGLSAEWTNLQSSGLAEDEFLAALVEAVTGQSVEPVQDTDNN